MSGSQEGGVVAAHQPELLLPGNPVSPGRLVKERTVREVISETKVDKFKE